MSVNNCKKNVTDKQCHQIPDVIHPQWEYEKHDVRWVGIVNMDMRITIQNGMTMCVENN